MVGHNGHYPGKVQTAMSAEGRMYYDHRVMRTTPTKVLEMLLDLPTLGTAVESAALMAVYCLLRPDSRNLGTRQNQILAKADKVDRFSTTKDHALSVNNG